MKHVTKKTCRLLALLLALSMVVCLAACGGKTAPETDGETASGAADAAPVLEKKAVVGVLQYAQHPSLDNCRTGFMAGLAEAGLTEGVDFEIDYENAGADDALDQQAAQNFAAKNVDLMLGIATPSAIACFAAAEDKNIPVIYSAITDPAAAGLVEGNVSGTSDKLPVEAQLQLIRALQPEAKTIGIIYTLSEPNSVSAIAEYQEKAPSFGFTIDARGVSSSDEIALAADALISAKVDAFSNLTDNNVVNVLSSVLEKTSEASIPVYGSEVEQVKLGCVASAGIDYVELGRLTGLMAAKVLKGEASAEEMEFETISDYATYVNSAALAAYGITLPEEIAASAIEANAQ